MEDFVATILYKNNPNTTNKYLMLKFVKDGLPPQTVTILLGDDGFCSLANDYNSLNRSFRDACTFDDFMEHVHNTVLVTDFSQVPTRQRYQDEAEKKRMNYHQ